MNTTKDGIEVKAGQIWEDLDKRMSGRRIKIVAVLNGRAYFGESWKRSIAINRMHKHSTGFRLVSTSNLTSRGDVAG